ncbi:SET domain-containing protein [Gramella lutea]|uniref:SET domain-containing protein n=1 Tax=Christiangramia lutea TaxID=1607951 RepID=A0A9X1V3I7_9FLAO|nr:SET domain-containing protein [Christiangramia lutea]MCH4822173.1 SET domain-containing protein [Christiangramia lutea]
MMHPDTRLKWINEKKGFGVVATRFIPKGTITWVQDELDMVFAPNEPESFKPLTLSLFEKYSFRNNKGEHILCWDVAKYINHSFNSNCLSTGYNFEISVRDITEGEELTDDYGYLNLSESFIPEDEGFERKIVNPDDILYFYKDWDEILKPLFPEILEVAQPLFDLLDKEIRKEIALVAAGKKKMLSTKNLYFQPEKSRI